MAEIGTTDIGGQEEKICIIRDKGTGEISWRFNTEGDPRALLLWTLFHSLMRDSGFAARIERLEREVGNGGNVESRS